MRLAARMTRPPRNAGFYKYTIECAGSFPDWAVVYARDPDEAKSKFELFYSDRVFGSIIHEEPS